MLQCLAVYAVRVLSGISYCVRNIIPLHALDVTIVEYAPFCFVLHLLNVPDDLAQLVNQFLSGLLNISLELVPLPSVRRSPSHEDCARAASRPTG